MRSDLFCAFLALFWAALGSTVQAAINPRELVLNITQGSITWEKLGVMRQDGRRQGDARLARVITISARLMGFSQPERASVEWFVLCKRDAGKFEYYATGSTSMLIPRTEPARVQILCQPLRRGETISSAYLTSTSVQPPPPDPASLEGWIVRISQGGRTITIQASRQGLLEWMARNPPPRR